MIAFEALSFEDFCDFVAKPETKEVFATAGLRVLASQDDAGPVYLLETGMGHAAARP